MSGLSDGNIAYLALVGAAFVVFIVTVAWAQVKSAKK